MAPAPQELIDRAPSSRHSMSIRDLPAYQRLADILAHSPHLGQYIRFFAIEIEGGLRCTPPLKSILSTTELQRLTIEGVQIPNNAYSCSLFVAGAAWITAYQAGGERGWCTGYAQLGLLLFRLERKYRARTNSHLAMEMNAHGALPSPSK
ncbi:hypothetical protein C8R45DRAFT_1219710 [Mycena sanguinolenta]|nr:hypothetical protein C8R45DRAFT_1219710 [Mycena sanguinolenta]